MSAEGSTRLDIDKSPPAGVEWRHQNGSRVICILKHTYGPIHVLILSALFLYFVDMAFDPGDRTMEFWGFDVSEKVRGPLFTLITAIGLVAIFWQNVHQRRIAITRGVLRVYKEAPWGRAGWAVGGETAIPLADIKEVRVAPAEGGWLRRVISGQLALRISTDHKTIIVSQRLSGEALEWLRNVIQSAIKAAGHS